MQTLTWPSQQSCSRLTAVFGRPSCTATRRKARVAGLPAQFRHELSIPRPACRQTTSLTRRSGTLETFAKCLEKAFVFLGGAVGDAQRARAAERAAAAHEHAAFF